MQHKKQYIRKNVFRKIQNADTDNSCWENQLMISLDNRSPEIHNTGGGYRNIEKHSHMERRIIDVDSEISIIRTRRQETRRARLRRLG